MTVRNRVRYCDRCGKSLRGQNYVSAVGVDWHADGCPRDAEVAEEAIKKIVDTVRGER